MKKLFPLLLVSCLLLGTGCSGIINQFRIHELREQTLLRAGFKPVAITTAAQEQQLEKLPAGKISTIQRQGKTYFIYPDLNHHRILVGRNRQFMQYNQLVTDQLSPPSKKDRLLEREWEESGVWNNIGGWGGIGWDDPTFLAY